jgi:hypothetical protein
VRYRLKTPYRDGTTHIVLESVDFIARVAALVPPPRVHLTRFHGVLAAHAALRAAITPAGRGARARGRVPAPPRLVAKEARMSWARRLKRVFGIEIEQCVRCGGRLTVIASIEQPELNRTHSRAPAGARRGGDTDRRARSPCPAAGAAVLIRDRRQDRVLPCFWAQETGDVARGTAARGFRPRNDLELGAKAVANPQTGRLNAARAAATLTECRAFLA